MIKTVVSILTLSIFVLEANAMDIEAQILKIRNASDSERYILVNELKQELSKLGRNERMGAIIALKQQLSSSKTQADSGTAVVTNSIESKSEQNLQEGQRTILTNFPSVAAVANPGTAMVGTVPPTVEQITPPRPIAVPVPAENVVKMLRTTRVVG